MCGLNAYIPFCLVKLLIPIFPYVYLVALQFLHPVCQINIINQLDFSQVGHVWWAVIIYSNGRKLPDLELATFARLDSQRASGI